MRIISIGGVRVVVGLGVGLSLLSKNIEWQFVRSEKVEKHS